MRITRFYWSLITFLIPIVSHAQEIRLVKDSLLSAWSMESGKVQTNSEYNKNRVNSLSKETFKHVDSFFNWKDYRINNSNQVNQRILVFELIKDAVSSDSLQVLAYNIAFNNKLGEVKGLETNRFVKLKEGPSKMPISRYLAKNKDGNLILLEINNGLVLDEAEYERKKHLVDLVFKWVLK